MWIRTIDAKWYVHEVRGVVYLSWVAAADREKAALFPEHNALDWLALLEKMSGMRLQAVAAPRAA